MALLLETNGAITESKSIEDAVAAAVAERHTTADIGGSLGTREVGDWIAGGVVPIRIFQARIARNCICLNRFSFSAARGRR